MSDSADIIEDLQSRLVFQEDAIDHLNKTVAEQASQIDILQQQVKYLHGQIKQISEQQSETGTAEIPPHY
ncbi:MAG: SlyX family protein [Gammaproteobacteria bacterium]|jgi:uncharacterized coiled-coil protein SlyX|nr:SlyX family protein [Gammaproteobacteria bacterium]